MKFNKISTLWRFLMYDCPYHYDIVDTINYNIYLAIFLIVILYLGYKNSYWILVDFNIFTIKMLKQVTIWWLISSPIAYYFTINEMYNNYRAEK